MYSLPRPRLQPLSFSMNYIVLCSLQTETNLLTEIIDQASWLGVRKLVNVSTAALQRRTRSQDNDDTGVSPQNDHVESHMARL